MTAPTKKADNAHPWLNLSAWRQQIMSTRVAPASMEMIDAHKSFPPSQGLVENAPQAEGTQSDSQRIPVRLHRRA
jgi:hypothetical protein